MTTTTASGSAVWAMSSSRGRAWRSSERTRDYVFLPIISGFPGDHQLLFTGATGRIYWRGRIGLGADFNMLWRWSNYYGRTNVARDNSEFRLYLTTSIPQWRD